MAPRCEAAADGHALNPLLAHSTHTHTHTHTNKQTQPPENLRLHRYPGGEALAGGGLGEPDSAEAEARRVADLGLDAAGGGGSSSGGGTSDDAVLAVVYRLPDNGGWEAVDVTPFDDGAGAAGGQQQQAAGAEAG
jgi:hypothetical protein